MRILWLVLLLTAGTFAQELIQNGRLREFDPGPLKVEDHAGAMVYLVPAGSTVVPGWKVTRSVQLVAWKGSGRNSWNMCGTGGISQQLSLVKGKRYRLAVHANRDDEGPKKQMVTVRLGGQSRDFEVKGETFEWVYSPEQPVITLEVAGRNPQRGPFLWSVSLTEYNPELDALRSDIGRIYRAMDGAVRRNGELAKTFEALAQDFSFKPVGGESLSATGFQDLLTRLASKKTDISSTLDDIKVTPTGAEIVVERTTRGYDDGGRPTTDRTSFKDVWVKTAAGWKWQSSEEIQSKD